MTESRHSENGCHVLGLKGVLVLYQRGMESFLQRENHMLPVMIRGIVLQKKFREQPRGPWQYFTIEEEGISLEARAQSTIDLPWNREVQLMVLLGIAGWMQNRLVPQLEVLSVLREEGRRRISPDERLTKWQAAIRQPKRDVESVFASHNPLVLIVTSDIGEAWTDVTAPLTEYREFIRLQRAPVRVSDPQAVGQVLQHAWQKQPTPELIILTRGGGDAVVNLDNDELLQLVTQRPIPIVTAIGHTRDHLILDQVVDKSFATPRDCGLWLRDGLARARRRHQETIDAKERKAHQQLLVLTGQHKQLQKELRRARRQTVALVILFGAVLLTFAYLSQGFP
ncbi:MAG TPA: hypothetical protein DD706_07605 [Nitrospiraceae bacterium]|nr:hypothetical protein [Nitrospiraceae bacterium]